MRRLHATSRGTSLVELTISTIAASIALLIGLTTWEMGWRGVRDVQYANVVYQNAFGAMNTIQEQIQKCTTIQIPDPNNVAYNSIQLLVPTQPPTGATVRRAFRLVGTNLIMEWKDENVGPVTIFTNVTAFTATILDAPTNSLAQLSCTCKAGTQTVSISTVAWKRN